MKMMMTLTAATLAMMLFAGCETAPTTQVDRDSLTRRAEATVAAYTQTDKSMQERFNNAYGYAVFPTIGKGAIGVGGAYGKGVVYEHGKKVGYCDLSQGSIGFQLGGQKYSEVIFFQNELALLKFKNGDFALAAQASAVAAKSGASSNADYENGVLVFTMGEAGLMYEASIGGQNFSFVPIK